MSQKTDRAAPKWQYLGKSVLACFVGAWLGVALLIIEEEMRGSAYMIERHVDILHWLLGGLSVGLRVLLSPMPLLAFVPMLVIGLPLQAALQHFGKVGYLWTVLPAIPFGPLVLKLLFVIYADVLRGTLNPFALVLTAVGGFLCTSIFWLVRRPDKDALHGQPVAK